MALSLSEKFIVKAEEELLETANVRDQSLKEFREWIAQHDYFADCRKGVNEISKHHFSVSLNFDFLDDKFLLQFLRTKKFRMNKATELFENYMLLKHSNPRYDFNDAAISKLWALYETGVAYPLTERDEEGRRIIFVQTRKLDPKLFSATDALQLLTWIAKVILEEEETQIAGIITIIDQSEISFNHLRLLSMRDAIDFVSVVRNGSVGRQKGMYLVSLPGFASFMLEIGKKAAGEKLKKRIHLVENMKAMKGLIDPKLLPLELGGEIPEAEMMSTFKKLAEERERDVRSIQEGIDWERIAMEGQNSSCSVM